MLVSSPYLIYYGFFYLICYIGKWIYTEIIFETVNSVNLYFSVCNFYNKGHCRYDIGILVMFCFIKEYYFQSNGLVVEALDSQYLVFKTTGWSFHPSEVDQLSTRNSSELGN